MKLTSEGTTRKDTKTFHNYFAAASGTNTSKAALSSVNGCSMSNRRCSANAKTSNAGIVDCSMREKTMAQYFPAAPGVKKRTIRWEKYFEDQIHSLALYQVPIKDQCADEIS